MTLNEADTRARLIDPALRESGWEYEGASQVSREVRVHREFLISEGRILGGGKRGKVKIADYVLEYMGVRLAIVEAKKFELNYTEGTAQAIE